jgi:amino acid transporter
MVFVLYAFGGWNDAAFLAAEVRDQRRNLPRALLISTSIITVIYLAMNSAYLAVLGFESARQSPTPAAEVLQQAFGHWGRTAISLLVMISALGAINGMILTGSRIYARLGADYRMMGWLATWNRRTAVPLVAIGTQGIAAILLILCVGTFQGRSLVDASLTAIGVPALPWDKYFGGFETLLAGSAPVFWTFFLLTGLAVFVLRVKHPSNRRPFSIPFFPLPPMIFCGTCLYMLYSSLIYARWLILLGVVPLVFGGLLWLVMRSERAMSVSDQR